MGESSLTEARQGLVNRARKLWTERLIDLTRPNNLLYYRPLELGSFDLEGFEPSALLDVLAGGSSLLTRLVPPKELEGAPEAIREDPTELEAEPLGAARRLVEIQRKADENLEERSLETMFVAFGLASGNPPDGGRNAEAAVLRAPLKLEGKEQRRALRRRGDLELNPALLYVLEREYGVPSLNDTLLALLPEDGARLHEMATHEALFVALERAAGHPGERRAVIRVLRQNVVKDRGAGARQADDEDRPRDLLARDLGEAFAIGDVVEAVHRVAEHALARDQAALALEGVEQQSERREEGAVAEVVEPARALSRLAEDRVDLEAHTLATHLDSARAQIPESQRRRRVAHCRHAEGSEP